MLGGTASYDAAGTYDYRETLAASQKVNWRIEDIIGGDKKLDFTKRFMPESLARVEQLPFLDDDEKRILNQIRGNTYLSIFVIVEEFIVPFVLDHIRPSLDEDDDRSAAFLQFMGEEVKHIQLFKTFARSQGFDGMGHRPGIRGRQEVLRTIRLVSPWRSDDRIRPRPLHADSVKTTLRSIRFSRA